MSAREAILGEIRRSLGRRATADAARDIEGRIARHEPNLVPQRAADAAKHLALFVERSERLGVSVDVVKNPGEVPDKIAAWLARHNLPARVKMSPDAALDAFPWSDSLLDVGRGRAAPDDLNSVTPAFAAVAETGTVMTVSDPARPTTLNFMPDNHAIVLKKSQIVGTLEAAWARFRDSRGGTAAMPRTVNLISGASRTGDIDARIYQGAHGPRRVHIVIVEDDAP
jgi:L-lactate dehydrogenase complex protein LldG